MGKFKIVKPTNLLNYCTDGSFENGTLGGWDTYPATGGAWIDYAYASGGPNNKSLYTVGWENPSPPTSSRTGLKGTISGTSTIAYIEIAADVYLPSWGDPVTGPGIHVWGGGTIGTNYLGSASHSGTLDKTERIGLMVTGYTSYTVLIGSITAPSETNRYMYADNISAIYSQYLNTTLGGPSALTSSPMITYFDGDSPGAWWKGDRNNSYSFYTYPNPGNDANGDIGLLYDLTDDLGYQVTSMQGAGFPSIQNVFTTSPLSDGSVYEGTNVGNSRLVLTSTINGTTLEDYHAQRAALIKLLGPFKDYQERAVTVYYKGGGEDKIARFYLGGGFQMNKAAGFAEAMQIVLEGADPYWYGMGEKTQIDGFLFDNSVNQIGTQGILRKVVANARDTLDYGWDKLSLASTNPNAGIFRILHDPRDGKVYVAGYFQTWGGVGVNAQNIAYWDPDDFAWHYLTSTTAIPYPTYQVRDMALRPEGGIYVVGDFLNAGGVAAADYIAIWEDGVGWSALRDPSFAGGAQEVRSVVVGHDGNIYFAGPRVYHPADDATAEGVMRYNKSTGLYENVAGAIGGGSVVYIRKMRQAPNGDLWCVGDFSVTIGSGSTVDVFKIEDYSTLVNPDSGTGATAGAILEVFIDDNGDVYVGGTQPDINYVAKWNGTTWIPLGTGLTAGLKQCYAITKHLGKIHVFGAFQGAGGVDIGSGAAVWDGSTWASMDLWVDDPAFGWSAAEVVNGDLWVGALTNTSGYVVYAGGCAKNVRTRGTARTYPTFRYEYLSDSSVNDIRLRYIQNLSTGKTCYLDYQFVEGEKLEITWNSEGAVCMSNLRGRVYPFLPGSDVSEMYIVPDEPNVWLQLVTSDPSNLRTGTMNFAALGSTVNVYWGVDDDI